MPFIQLRVVLYQKGFSVQQYEFMMPLMCTLAPAATTLHAEGFLNRFPFIAEYTTMHINTAIL